MSTLSPTKMNQATHSEPGTCCTDPRSQRLPMGERGLEGPWLSQNLFRGYSSEATLSSPNSTSICPLPSSSHFRIPKSSFPFTSPTARQVVGKQVEIILASPPGCYSAAERVKGTPTSRAIASVNGWLWITRAFAANTHPLTPQQWPQKGRDPDTTSGSVNLVELSRDRFLERERLQV